MTERIWLFNIKDCLIVKRTCVCSEPNCKELTNEFASIGDVRGRYSTFPQPPKADDKRVNFAKRQTFRSQRAIACLAVDPAVCGRTDERRRSKDVIDRARTKSGNQDQKRAPVYVANWHYAPWVINEHIYNKEKKEIRTRWGEKCLAQAFINQHGGEVGSGYERADRFPSDCQVSGYPILPNYSYLNAMTDLKKAQRVRNTKTTFKRHHVCPACTVAVRKQPSSYYVRNKNAPAGEEDKVLAGEKENEKEKKLNDEADLVAGLWKKREFVTIQSMLNRHLQDGGGEKKRKLES